MHELAVAQALVDQVDAVIDAERAYAATLIRLRIGPLAGVVPDLLACAFPLVAEGRRMQHARLEFAEAPITVRCRSCGAETYAAMNRLVCGACGDWKTQILSGDELLLESVELETAPSLTPES